MIAARNLNMTEATAQETKHQGDQVARTERLPKSLHKWTLPFQPGGNQLTLRKQGPASRDLGSRNRITERFSIQMLSEE